MRFTKKTIAITLIVILTIGGLATALADNIGEIITNITDTVTEFVTGVPTTERKYYSELDEYLEQIDESEFLTEDVIKKVETEAKPEKMLKGLKMVAHDKNLTEKQIEKFNRYILDNDDIVAVTALYDVMFEGFFTYDNLDSAIQRFDNGESLDNIIDEFYNLGDDYLPHQYPDGQLEYLIETVGIGINELAISEVLASRGLIEVETVINRLSEHENFSDICDEFGIINTEQLMNSVNIHENEVEECMQAMGVSEKEAMQKISKAKKAGVSDTEVIKHIKGRKSNGSVKRQQQSDIFNR